MPRLPLHRPASPSRRIRSATLLGLVSVAFTALSVASPTPAHALCFNLPDNSQFCGPTGQQNYMGDPINGSKAWGVSFIYHFG